MQRWWFHLLLFVATGITVFTSYLISMAVGDTWAELLINAAMFSGSVLLILGSHEMGHWLMAREHRVESSLPYFIPLPPMLGFGTLGAVIRLKGRIPSKNALVDIGAAGPLAGLLIALPLLVVGMSLSQVVTAPVATSVAPKFSLIGVAMSAGSALRSWIYDVPVEPAGEVAFFGNNLIILGVQHLVVGPLQAGQDVALHPVGIAAWFGLVVTMLNLIPVGQLDGGHLTYALFGSKAVQVGERVALVLLLLGFFCSVSWLVWFFVVTKVVGFGHPPVVADAEPLSRSRRAVCILGLVLTVLTFMPVPVDAI